MTEIYSGAFSRVYGEKKPKVSPNDEYHRVTKKEPSPKGPKPT